MDRLARAIAVITPRLRRVERLVRPRWPAVFRSSKRPTGFLILLLGLTLISPFPFSHVIPAFVIMLLALSYPEEDGIVLLLSLVASLSSVAITAAALWGSIETADWLDRIWPSYGFQWIDALGWRMTHANVRFGSLANESRSEAGCLLSVQKRT